MDLSKQVKKAGQEVDAVSGAQSFFKRADDVKISKDIPKGTHLAKNSNWQNRKKICGKITGSSVIFWDGRVGACGCADFDARFVMGDICSEPLRNILNSEKRKKFIESFGTPDLNEYCVRCTFYC